MKKRRVKALFLACAAMMSISLIGCGGTAQEDGTQTSKSSAQADSENTVKSEVHYAFSAQPPTLDLHTTSTTVAYTIGRVESMRHWLLWMKIITIRVNWQKVWISAKIIRTIHSI